MHNTPTGPGSLALLADEFPGFPLDCLPEIPHDLPAIPTHWHNDACPSWAIAGAIGHPDETRLFIDYPHGHDLREMEGPRFILSGDMGGEEILSSDDWAETLDTIRAVQNTRGIPTD